MIRHRQDTERIAEAHGASVAWAVAPRTPTPQAGPPSPRYGVGTLAGYETVSATTAGSRTVNVEPSP